MVKEGPASKNGCIINQERIDNLVLLIYHAAINGRGIFKGGPEIWKRKYLPQWRIPKDLEYSPQREETKNPEEAALFLWSSILFERQAKSSFLEKQLHQIWNDPKKHWFFIPEEIIERDLEEIDQIMKDDMHYTLKAVPHRSFGDTYQRNARLLLEKYNSDPKNLVHLLTVEESRERHMEFEGVGTGIANLNIIHFTDRKIANPLDPENMLFKVDVHKGRIPINVEAIIPKNGNREIHVSSIVEGSEKAYWNTCRKYSLDPKIADAAIWIIGSLVCTKRNYRVCLSNCPLASNNTCIANTPLNQQNGRYQIKDETGERIDTRRDMGSLRQLHLLELYNEEFNAYLE